LIIKSKQLLNVKFHRQNDIKELAGSVDGQNKKNGENNQKIKLVTSWDAIILNNF
jgi:hypothetical protein